MFNFRQLKLLQKINRPLLKNNLKKNKMLNEIIMIKNTE